MSLGSRFSGHPEAVKGKETLRAMIQREEVQKLAYELYEKNGRREGRDLLDWLAAEQMIRFQQMILPGTAKVALLEYRPLTGAGPALALPEGSRTRRRKTS